MRLRTMFQCVSFLLLLLSLHGYAGADLFKVSETFNGRPFEYQLKELERRDLHTVYAISFPSPLSSSSEINNTVHGELFLPNGIPQDISCPAVLINHVMAGGFDLERMMCTTLANQGVAAMFVMMPYYGLRGKHHSPRGILESAERFMDSMEQGMLDNRRAIDILSSRTEINSARIGIAGGSMGAIISAGVCGFEPRIERIFLLLGGGNLEKIFRNSCRETKPFREMLQGLGEDERQATLLKLRRFDPLSQSQALARLAAQGKMKMICAAEDEVIPPACSKELAEAAQCDIIWLPKVNHYTVVRHSGFIFTEMADFFSSNPSLTWQPVAKQQAASQETLALRLLSGFLRDLQQILAGVPAEGHAHHLGLELELNAGEKSFHSQIKLSRAAAGKFKLFADIPKLGKGWIGQGEFPWMAGAKNSLFVGSQNPLSGESCASFISPEQIMKYQMGLGILATGAMAPEMLKKVAEWSIAEEDDNKTRIVLNIKHASFKSRLHILCDQKGKPESGNFHAKNLAANFKISDWRLNSETEADFFSPPENLKGQPVSQEDILRMSAAVFERLLESVN